MQTVEEAKQFVHENRDDGVVCPCCEQYAKTYKRNINAEMTRFLAHLVTLYEETQDWVHLEQLKDDMVYWGTNGTLLLHWDFIEAESRKSGRWKPTTAGILFAKGITDAPKYVVLYNNEVLRFSDERVKFADCQKAKFSLPEVMTVNV